MNDNNKDKEKKQRKKLVRETVKIITEEWEHGVDYDTLTDPDRLKKIMEWLVSTNKLNLDDV